MGKILFVIGATVCILAAAPLTFAAAISIAVFQAAFSIGSGNRREPDVKAYTVYRYDFIRHAREPVGLVLERRMRERGNNYMDLLKLAKKTYSESLQGSYFFLIPSPG
jgi:hypothetical protein